MKTTKPMAELSKLTKTTEPKRILVYGAGAIGSTFGGMLATAGHHVAMVGRKRHLDEIRRKGLRMTGLLGRRTIKTEKFSFLVEKITQIPKGERNFDYVLVSVRASQTEDAAKDLKKNLKTESFYVSLQNGLGNVEALCKHHPKSRVIGARVIFGVIIDHGRVHISVWADDVLLGAAVPEKKKILPAAKDLAKILTGAGIKTTAVPNIHPYIWAKVCYNGSLNALATILNCTYGKLIESDATRTMLKDVVHENYAVAKAHGITLIPASPNAYVKLLFERLVPATYDHVPSMSQALARPQLTEIDSLNGAVVQLGRKKKVPTPVNLQLTRLVYARESLLGLR